MPTLHWIGKDKVANHHHDVPFHILDKKYSFPPDLSDLDLSGFENLTGLGSGNKIIHGDNLLALKALLPEYEGKIKCIYIDPPYNTGNENWVYNDNVNHPQIKKWLGQVVGREAEDLTRHDKWLCMMYPRLMLLQKLLADDGAIFISIDDNEQANLKLICDEIFGSGNFVSTIHWRRTESQNNNAKHLSTVGEYILCYLKTGKNNIYFNKIELNETAVKEYRYEDEKGKFRRGTIVDNSRGKHLLDVIAPNGMQKTIKSIRTREFFDENEKKGMIYWTDTGTPYLKLYLHKSEGQISNNWFDKEGVNEDAAEDLVKYNIDFQFSKPNSLVQKLISLICDSNSLILDSFAGSGTTAHAVINLNKADGGNRKFILVEMEDYAETITAERVRRVGGAFDFYELGLPLFEEDGNLNEKVPTEKIREYIYFMETKSLPNTGESGYFLGKHSETAYYFYYEKESQTNLDYDFLSTIKIKAEQYVIYADNCLLTKAYMLEKHIIFKKIPRDISKL